MHLDKEGGKIITGTGLADALKDGRDYKLNIKICWKGYAKQGKIAILD